MRESDFGVPQTQSALMNSLKQNQAGAKEARPAPAVSAETVQELEEMLLLPKAQIEAALRKADGDLVAATKVIFEEGL